MQDDTQPTTTREFARRAASHRAKDEEARAKARKAVKAREADLHGRIAAMEQTVALLTKTAKASDQDQSEREAEQDAKTAKLERLVSLLVKANREKAEAIRSLKAQVNTLTTYVQRLQASQAIPARKKRRECELSAALERQLNEGLEFDR